MRDIVTAYDAYRRARQEMESAREMLRHEKDPDMQEYLRSEERRASDRLAELEEQLKVLLLPKEQNEDRDVVVEIQGAEGSDEAAQLADALFRRLAHWEAENG